MRHQNSDSYSEARLEFSQGFWYPGFCRKQGWTDLRANLKSHREKFLLLDSMIHEVPALPGFHLTISVAPRRSGFFFFFFLSSISGMLFFPVNSTSVKVGSGLQSLTAQYR